MVPFGTRESACLGEFVRRHWHLCDKWFGAFHPGSSLSTLVEANIVRGLPIYQFRISFTGQSDIGVYTQRTYNGSGQRVSIEAIKGKEIEYIIAVSENMGSVKRTVSISEEQDEFLEEHHISPSKLFQEAIEEKREEIEG